MGVAVVVVGRVAVGVGMIVRMVVVAVGVIVVMVVMVVVPGAGERLFLHADAKDGLHWHALV